MDIRITLRGDCCTVYLGGYITLTEHPNLLRLFGILIEGKVRHYQFDFSDVEWVDSSGLGLFLEVRALADEQKATVEWQNLKEQPRKMLSLLLRHGPPP